MEIELLFFEGCPSFEPTLKLLTLVLQEERVNASVKHINVNTEELAQKNRFLGSPSIRINGKDIEVDARTSSDFGQKCRVYDCGGSLSGVPPESLIRKAVLESGQITPVVTRGNQILG